MSVEKNVSFGLRMKGIAKAEMDQRVREVMKIVQLEGFEKRFPSQLSGGQQQRVAIARTVVTNPRLLLMDEPLSNLDAKLREEMRTFITDLQKRLSITTVFVTHDQIEAIELADQIGVIFDGELVQFGTPEDIFNRPSNARVADFMGATNIIRGRLKSKALLETSAGALQVSQAPLQAEGSLVSATIRPEHIDISQSSEQSNSFKANVRQAIYYGGIVSYIVQSADLELNVKDRSTRRFKVGEEVSVHLGKDHIWVFPN
jgi:putative spermidine/putrescine transport system ATP-binding protein